MPDKKDLKTESVKTNTETSEIEISEIKEPKFHDRKTIDKESIVNMSKSIESIGLLYPITVRKLSDGTLERISGYRRIEACKLIGMKRIPAVIISEIEDKEATMLMVSENLQRKNLNIFEETTAIVKYLSLHLEVDFDELKRMLYRFKNTTLKNIKSLTDEDIETIKKIEEALKKHGLPTLPSFANRLNIFNFHPLIQNALEKGEISIRAGQTINKLKSSENIKQTLEFYRENSPKTTELKKYMEKIEPSKKHDRKETDEFVETLKDRLKDTAKVKIDILYKIPEKERHEIDRYLDRIDKIITLNR